ncbi:MAG: sugar phosphate nucleotidyltransferase [Candidatus Peribacteraceae bacterium]|nr:sugar phosphate nucleotidyltransferase [Candidatus Peribacteraceae bacterium]
MKGVLICGGTGSRLRPLTDVTNKSLLPVYDKPLILYPLQVLLDAGIRDIAVITGKEHLDQMTHFLGSGERFGCSFAFKVQEKPGGIAQALGLAESFVDGSPVCAILGDNIFFDDLAPIIKNFKSGGHVFLKEVPDPERFGVANIDGSVAKGTFRVTSIEEKPPRPKSNFAVTGCYVYDKHCFEIIRTMKPSARGELEITDVSRAYMEAKSLAATVLQKEWIDAGTFESLFRATELVRNQRSASI